MGIRYNRDSRRATNGPMIFFTDPSAEIDLRDEIRGAISSQLSFYAYRRPGDMMISYGSSEGFVEGIGIPGFAIAPFNPNLPAITIPWRPIKSAYSGKPYDCRFPAKSTTFHEYASEIESIRSMLKTQGGGKTVASRVICKDGKIDVGATFSELCRRYPDAFVFTFSTPLTGCWIGATPELLLNGAPGKLSTMALAGTRKAGDSGEWDIKNSEEQQMVADYIVKCLKSHGLETYTGEKYNRQAGDIEHICTPISAFPSEIFDESCLISLLKELSPTPAVCGLPKKESLKLILEKETHERGCYGGFCGPFSSLTDFSFHVVLRCALIEDSRYALFAGGGITMRSAAEDEWNETEMKAGTLMQTIVPD